MESVEGSQNGQAVTVLIPGDTPRNPRKRDKRDRYADQVGTRPQRPRRSCGRGAADSPNKPITVGPPDRRLNNKLSVFFAGVPASTSTISLALGKLGTATGVPIG